MRRFEFRMAGFDVYTDDALDPDVIVVRDERSGKEARGRLFPLPSEDAAPKGVVTMLGGTTEGLAVGRKMSEKPIDDSAVLSDHYGIEV